MNMLYMSILDYIRLDKSITCSMQVRFIHSSLYFPQGFICIHLLSLGYYATRALRIEKFYAFWGQDLDTFTTPLECGRSWRVKFNVSSNLMRV